jgi:arabinogalactan endo-1,4-beta-galactosidase
MKRLCLATAFAAAMFSQTIDPGRAAAAEPFYFGADLSAANEMADCGAKYLENGVAQDPFALFAAHGINLVRVRLWKDPEGKGYSGLADVEKTIARARAQGMKVLLDFHYADSWADGDHQPPPRAWAGIKDPEKLAAALYQYTYETLTTLDKQGLMPDLVQVGNETNAPLLGGRKGDAIDWDRNALLFTAGIKAVRDASAASTIKPRIMIHIAQPENVEPWFKAAVAAGVSGFDIIGVSYYPKWSKQSLTGLGETINRLRHRYHVDVMVVETGYPWTLDYADSTPNVLGAGAVVSGYPATPEGQKKFLVDLTQTVIANDGDGVVYWAPDWVSTGCRTPWGIGSSWENATFFDFHKRDEVLPAIDFPRQAYVHPVTVTFRFQNAGPARPDLYLWGDFLGARDLIVHLHPDASGGFTYAAQLMPGRVIHYQVFDHLPLREGLLPVEAGAPLAAATVEAGPTTVARTLPGR